MVITLTGANDFGWSAELEKLIAKFVAGHGEMALERVDGEEADFQKIYDALTGLPFLASKKLVVLRAGSANKKFAEDAEDLLKNLSATTDVILLEPKLDKRSSYYKYLKKSTDFREFNELDENGLARWLAETAKEKNAKLVAGDARFIVERLGKNQELLKNTLDILALSGSEITKKTIEQMTEPTPQSRVFDLLEAAFAGRTAAALRIYEDQRQQKVEPAVIISMLAWQLRILAAIKAAGQSSPAEIAKNSKISPYVVSKNLLLARGLKMDYIKKLVSDLLALDIRLKSEAIDADEALRLYLLNLAQFQA